MEVKHIAGIGFAAGGALENERNLAVGDGVLGEIIVNDERIHPIFHEPLAHGGAGVRCDILVSRVVGGGSRDDDGVLHRGLEGSNGAGDVGILLADGYVDRIERAKPGIL